MWVSWEHRIALLLLVLHGGDSGSCPFSSPEPHHRHHCDHGHHQHYRHEHHMGLSKDKLPEELTVEEDLKFYGLDSRHDHHDHDNVHFHDNRDSQLSSLVQGKPSNTVVDSFAAFGAGSMLGDDFLHQLPHAYAGIVLFLLVEKVVRYAEACSGNGGKGWGRGHHYHHHKSIKKLDKHDADDSQVLHSIDEKDGGVTDKLSNGEVSDGVSGNCLNEEKHAQLESLLHKRTTDTGARHHDKPGFDAANSLARKLTPSTEKGLESSSSNLVFGYLNLFSDGVYNFTDGIAHASAFLLYGTVGGLSRTLFLLSHELPQEVGDSGILIRSGFSAPNALIFNFLSALVALAATVLGFTAGGFIYIAVSVAGVLPEMNSRNITVKSTAIRLALLILGMAVALCISRGVKGHS